MVIRSEPAKADLRAIHDFIAHDSRRYSRKLTQDTVDRIINLDELPRRGNIVPELDNEAIRPPVFTYRILYEIREPDIVILALIHKRRDLQAGMLDR